MFGSSKYKAMAQSSGSSVTDNARFLDQGHAWPSERLLNPITPILAMPPNLVLEPPPPLPTNAPSHLSPHPCPNTDPNPAPFSSTPPPSHTHTFTQACAHRHHLEPFPCVCAVLMYRLVSPFPEVTSEGEERSSEGGISTAHTSDHPWGEGLLVRAAKNPSFTDDLELRKRVIEILDQKCGKCSLLTLRHLISRTCYSISRPRTRC